MAEIKILNNDAIKALLKTNKDYTDKLVNELGTEV